MTQVSSLPASRDSSSPFDDILRELCAEDEVCSGRGMEGQADALDSLLGRTRNHQVSLCEGYCGASVEYDTLNVASGLRSLGVCGARLHALCAHVPTAMCMYVALMHLPCWAAPQDPADSFLDSILGGANPLGQGPIATGPPGDVLSGLLPPSPQGSDGYGSTEQRSPYSESGLSDSSTGVQHSPLSLSDEVLRDILAPSYPPPAVHTAGESTPVGAPVGDFDYLQEEADVDCDGVAELDLGG